MEVSDICCIFAGVITKIKITKTIIKYEKTKTIIDSDTIKKDLRIRLDFENFDEWKENIYSKMVKKVGSRVYWETWAKDIAEIAKTHVDRIKLILNKHDEKIDICFNEFLKGLRNNLNNSINKADAILCLPPKSYIFIIKVYHAKKELANKKTVPFRKRLSG